MKLRHRVKIKEKVFLVSTTKKHKNILCDFYETILFEFKEKSNKHIVLFQKEYNCKKLAEKQHYYILHNIKEFINNKEEEIK